MKFIRIKNNGLIEPQALHLVGASTKRNDSSKIGQFGSGNKYALAYFLRNGYNIRVFAGTTEIPIFTKKESFRDNEFNLIYINDEKTSITTEMGKDWQFWQAIREVYCNAIDEGGCHLDLVETIDPIENETHFYIDTKKDVLEFIGNFDNYFATKKKILFEGKTGRILEKSGTTANIYRKGIKCVHSNKASIFDYDFNDIQIDENRIVMYNWLTEEKLWDLIFECDNEEIIMQILHACGDSNNFEGSISDISTISSKNVSELFKKKLRETNLAPKAYAGLLKPDEVHNHIIVPMKIFDSVRGIIKDENVGDKFKVAKDGALMRDMETTPLYDETIKKALYFFKECGFDIPYEIRVVISNDKDLLGAAVDDTIVLTDVCLEKGINEVVNTILEEFIHIKYGAKDETRNFQTATITEFISYMKKLNSFVI